MTFSTATALRLLDFADDAYQSVESDANFQKGLRALSGTTHQFYSREAWREHHGYQYIENPQEQTAAGRYYGIVTTDGDSLVIAFRGTLGIIDLLVDAQGTGISRQGVARIPLAVWPVGDRPDVWVHKRFLGFYLGVRDNLRATVGRMLHDTPTLTKLYVTGHSLGGALATMCALDLGLVGATHDGVDYRVPRPRLWTFASPLVGNQAMAELTESKVEESVRIHHTWDPVPLLPPNGFTPPWLAWYADQVGPEPSPAFVPLQHVTGSQVLTNMAWPVLAHFLAPHYAGCKQRQSYTGDRGLRADELVESLTVHITTRETLTAGTDNDVYLKLGAVEVGPLNTGDDAFEPGTSSDFDLIAMFPTELPKNTLRVRDLHTLGLRLAPAMAHYRAWAVAWEPESVVIRVNGVILARIDYERIVDWADNGNVFEVPVEARV